MPWTMWKEFDVCSLQIGADTADRHQDRVSPEQGLCRGIDFVSHRADKNRICRME